MLRSAFEAIENCEKVLAIAYQNRKKFLTKEHHRPTEGDRQNDTIVSSSRAVWWDMLIKDLTETMHKKSKEIVSIYEDCDGSYKAE